METVNTDNKIAEVLAEFVVSRKYDDLPNEVIEKAKRHIIDAAGCIVGASNETQAKILRVIQEKEIQPLGSNKTIKVDVRILAATNVDLKEKIKLKEFREDLFYRLNIINIHLPPLRERKEDIPLLVKNFIIL